MTPERSKSNSPGRANAPKTKRIIKGHVRWFQLREQVRFISDANNTIEKVKRQPTEQEEIFLKHVYDKGFLSIIYKELIIQ